MRLTFGFSSQLHLCPVCYWEHWFHVLEMDSCSQRTRETTTGLLGAKCGIDFFFYLRCETGALDLVQEVTLCCCVPRAAGGGAGGGQRQSRGGPGLAHYLRRRHPPVRQPDQPRARWVAKPGSLVFVILGPGRRARIWSGVWNADHIAKTRKS